MTLSDVLGQLQSFLSDHPGEFVILRAQVENEGNDFTTNMNAIVDRYRDILWDNPDPADSRTRPCRRFAGRSSCSNNSPRRRRPSTPTASSTGLPASRSRTTFKWSTDWDLYGKWTKIVANWTAAIQYAKTDDTSEGYITYISASGGEPAPWFFSSGYITATDGDALLTGLTNKTHGASDYPDFKWVSCVPDIGGDLCSVAFTGTNILMYDVLSGQNRAGGPTTPTCVGSREWA